MMQKEGPDDTLPLASHVWKEKKKTEEIMFHFFFEHKKILNKKTKNYGSVLSGAW